MCEITASERSAAQLKDAKSIIAVECILAGVSVGDITEEVVSDTVDKKEVKRLVSRGELMELPNSRNVLVPVYDNAFPLNLPIAMTGLGTLI